eukprot:EG_transcript_40668
MQNSKPEGKTNQNKAAGKHCWEWSFELCRETTYMREQTEALYSPLVVGKRNVCPVERFPLALTSERATGPSAGRQLQVKALLLAGGPGPARRVGPLRQHDAHPGLPLRQAAEEPGSEAVLWVVIHVLPESL